MSDRLSSPTTASHLQQQGQMTASIPAASSERRDTIARFGRIGLPALAAAAEVVKSAQKAEKPFHARFYQNAED